MNFLKSILECIVEFSEYVFFGAALLIVLFLIFRNFPKDIFRKLLHAVAFSSLVEMTLIADTFYYAALSSLLFAVIVYPVLCFLEKYPFYKSLFVEKSPGEVKKSLIEFFLMYAVLVSVTWGIFKEKETVAVSLLMWGVGDAAAAVIGRRFGRHRIRVRFADRNKSWEGSSAFVFFSFLAGTTGFCISRRAFSYEAVILPLITSPFSAYTELISKKGRDTFTVPLVTSMVLILLSYIFF